MHANTRQLYLKNVPSSVSTMQLQHKGPGKLLEETRSYSSSDCGVTTADLLNTVLNLLIP